MHLVFLSGLGAIAGVKRRARVVLNWQGRRTWEGSLLCERWPLGWHPPYRPAGTTVVPQDQETANLALQDSREEAAALQDALAAAEERQGQLEGHLRRRRAALRWRYAAAAALLPAAARAEAVQRWELGMSGQAALPDLRESWLI